MKPSLYIDAAAAVMGVRRKDMLTRRATGNARAARLLACGALRDVGCLAFAAIGDELGTTRMRAHQMYQTWLGHPANLPDRQRPAWRAARLAEVRGILNGGKR